MYITRKTGTGKSTLLEMMIRQDIESGQGMALIDPHGDLIERIFQRIPQDKKDNLIYFNVPDNTKVIGFSPEIKMAAGKRKYFPSQKYHP